MFLGVNMKIDLTKEELYYIERTADIESLMALNNFFNIVSIPKEKLTNQEFKMLEKYSHELITTYNILKELRIKLERLRK